MTMTAKQLFDAIFKWLDIESEQCSYLGKLYELAEHYGVRYRGRTEAGIMQAICSVALLESDNYLYMDMLNTLHDSMSKNHAIKIMGYELDHDGLIENPDYYTLDYVYVKDMQIEVTGISDQWFCWYWEDKDLICSTFSLDDRPEGAVYMRCNSRIEGYENPVIRYVHPSELGVFILGHSRL